MKKRLIIGILITMVSSCMYPPNSLVVTGVKSIDKYRAQYTMVGKGVSAKDDQVITIVDSVGKFRIDDTVVITKK